jgi:hypothetical protein
MKKIIDIAVKTILGVAGFICLSWLVGMMFVRTFFPDVSDLWTTIWGGVIFFILLSISTRGQIGVGGPYQGNDDER